MKLYWLIPTTCRGNVNTFHLSNKLLWRKTNQMIEIFSHLIVTLAFNFANKVDKYECCNLNLTKAIIFYIFCSISSHGLRAVKFNLCCKKMLVQKKLENENIQSNMTN